MPIATARANAAKSSIRAHIEHVFAHQKNRFGLFIRTIGIKRAEAKLTLANLAYSFDAWSSTKGAWSRHESVPKAANRAYRASRTSKSTGTSEQNTVLSPPSRRPQPNQAVLAGVQLVVSVGGWSVLMSIIERAAGRGGHPDGTQALSAVIVGQGRRHQGGQPHNASR
jgi:hypothetical protein